MLSICCHVLLEHAPPFNGAWWLEHGRQFTRTQHCYAFIYFFESFFKHSALFSALQRHPFPWSPAKRDGKTKVCVECEVEGRGGSPEHSGLRLEHEIVRREASWLAQGKHEAHSLHLVIKSAWRRLVFHTALTFTRHRDVIRFLIAFGCTKIYDDVIF